MSKAKKDHPTSSNEQTAEIEQLWIITNESWPCDRKENSLCNVFFLNFQNHAIEQVHWIIPEAKKIVTSEDNYMFECESRCGNFFHSHCIEARIEECTGWAPCICPDWAAEHYDEQLWVNQNFSFLLLYFLYFLFSMFSSDINTSSILEHYCLFNGVSILLLCV